MPLTIVTADNGLLLRDIDPADRITVGCLG